MSQVEATLGRIANIAAGFNWKHGASYDIAFNSTNVAVVAICYHLAIPHSPDVESMILKSIYKGLSIYYTRNGRLREQPVGHQEVDFSETLYKLT